MRKLLTRSDAAYKLFVSALCESFEGRFAWVLLM